MKDKILKKQGFLITVLLDYGMCTGNSELLYAICDTLHQLCEYRLGDIGLMRGEAETSEMLEDIDAGNNSPFTGDCSLTRHVEDVVGFLFHILGAHVDSHQRLRERVEAAILKQTQDGYGAGPAVSGVNALNALLFLSFFLPETF